MDAVEQIARSKLSKTILAIDDALTICNSLNALLSAECFDVLLAEDGRGAETIAANNDIELVVCDVNMPRMNGLQTLKWVRSRAATKELRFILLTTEKKRPWCRKRVNLARVAG
ncbi:MAG: response regulator [Deltaproteobacteria bacterium]|nr:response regulator [Deltaproteobacteria bacterium]